MRNLLLVLIPLALAAGCDAANRSIGSSNDGPFGPPKATKLMEPFAGDWVCDEAATKKILQDAGATEQQLELTRKFNEGKLHPDLKITGNCIHDGSLIASEYYLFGLHQHGEQVCGKAWHHEDRHDPGDMSKCYVRLKIQGGLLYLETKMQDGNPDLNDPDIVTQTIEGSAANCTAVKPPGKDWSDWGTLVFRRK